MSGNIWYLATPQVYVTTAASANELPQKEDTRWVLVLTDVTALVILTPTLWAEWATESQTFWALTAWTFIPWVIEKVTTVTWWTVSVAY